MPPRRSPNRNDTGQPVLDRIMRELRTADTAFEERVVESRLLHLGRYMTFEQATIAHGERRSSRDIVVHPGAVVMAPLDSDGCLLFVIQYRFATGGALLELPAGTLEVRDGVTEDPAAAAHRELEEETGYRAGSLERLGGFWSAPGFSTEYLTLYLATDLRPAGEGRLKPDEDENLRLCRVHWRDAVAAVEAGVIEDAKSAAGILWVANRMSKDPGQGGTNPPGRGDVPGAGGAADGQAGRTASE